MKSKRDISSWAYNSLYGVPMSFKYAGHFKGIPVFTRDDVPKGMLYFINSDHIHETDNPRRAN